MVQKQYGHLLFDAIRETLENMAFAEVIPQSMIIGQQEFIDEIRKKSSSGDLQDDSATDSWGTAPAANGSAKEDSNETPFDEQEWGTSLTTNDVGQVSNTDDWGNTPSSTGSSSFPDSAWEKPLDSWGDASLFSEPEEMQYTSGKDNMDFDVLAKQQQNWYWSCLKVNSPELDAVWFVIPQDLLKELARTMYAGEDNMNVDTALMRDIIAELTNVIGGRLMLLLEEIIGKFTLEVPVTGAGLPDFDDKNIVNETVICKVLVDGAYPVLSTMSFRDDVSLQNQAEKDNVKLSQK